MSHPRVSRPGRWTNGLAAEMGGPILAGNPKSLPVGSEDWVAEGGTRRAFVTSENDRPVPNQRAGLTCNQEPKRDWPRMPIARMTLLNEVVHGL